MTTVPRSFAVVPDDRLALHRLLARSYCRQAPVTTDQATPMPDLPRRTILAGDATAVLRSLPAACINCVVTSPPYYLLRNYDVDGQLGIEPSVDGWVDRLVAVCDELARVLKPTGALWLNLGDSYSRHVRYGAPPKGLLLGPERLLLRLAARGWVVRNKLVWAKPNPLPASVADRLTCSWEPLYLLVRSRHYFFDLDAIRQPHSTSRAPSRSPREPKYGGQRPAWGGPLAGRNDGLERAHRQGRVGHALGKNPGDVWTIATGHYRGAHFATFPEALVEPPIRATCPEALCTACDRPWRRSVSVTRHHASPHNRRGPATSPYAQRWTTTRTTGPLRPRCQCDAPARPGIVLDPFIGSGTTAVVAERLGREWLGIDLNADYRRLAEARIRAAREV